MANKKYEQHNQNQQAAETDTRNPIGIIQQLNPPSIPVASPSRGHVPKTQRGARVGSSDQKKNNTSYRPPFAPTPLPDIQLYGTLHDGAGGDDLSLIDSSDVSALTFETYEASTVTPPEPPPRPASNKKTKTTPRRQTSVGDVAVSAPPRKNNSIKKGRHANVPLPPTTTAPKRQSSQRTRSSSYRNSAPPLPPSASASPKQKPKSLRNSAGAVPLTPSTTTPKKHTSTKKTSPKSSSQRMLPSALGSSAPPSTTPVSVQKTNPLSNSAPPSTTPVSVQNTNPSLKSSAGAVPTTSSRPPIPPMRKESSKSPKPPTRKESSPPPAPPKREEAAPLPPRRKESPALNPKPKAKPKSMRKSKSKKAVVPPTRKQSATTSSSEEKSIHLEDIEVPPLLKEVRKAASRKFIKVRSRSISDIATEPCGSESTTSSPKPINNNSNSNSRHHLDSNLLPPTLRFNRSEDTAKMGNLTQDIHVAPRPEFATTSDESIGLSDVLESHGEEEDSTTSASGNQQHQADMHRSMSSLTCGTARFAPHAPGEAGRAANSRSIEIPISMADSQSSGQSSSTNRKQSSSSGAATTPSKGSVASPIMVTIPELEDVPDFDWSRIQIDNGDGDGDDREEVGHELDVSTTSTTLPSDSARQGEGRTDSDDTSHASRTTIRSLLTATWTLVFPSRRTESIVRTTPPTVHATKTEKYEEKVEEPPPKSLMQKRKRVIVCVFSALCLIILTLIGVIIYLAMTEQLAMP